MIESGLQFNIVSYRTNFMIFQAFVFIQASSFSDNFMKNWQKNYYLKNHLYSIDALSLAVYTTWKPRGTWSTWKDISK